MAEREKEECDCPQSNTSPARGRQCGIWKGDGDALFLRGNSSGVECAVIWDPFTLHWEEVMNGYMRRLFSVISRFAILCFFFLCFEFFCRRA